MKTYIKHQHGIIIANSTLVSEPRYHELIKLLIENNYKVDDKVLKCNAISSETMLLVISTELINDIFTRANSEWKVKDEHHIGNTHCSLCGQPNEQIFYIQNINNGTVLNVGSTCISNYFNLSNKDNKYIKDSVKYYECESRKIELYSNYPDIDKQIKGYEIKRKNISLVLPFSLEKDLTARINETKQFITDYVNSKVSKKDLYKLNEFIKNCDISFRKSSQWISENSKNPYVVTKPIQDHLLKLKDGVGIKVLNEIQSNGGYVSRHTVKYINHIDFVRRFIDDFNNRIEKTKYSINDDTTEELLECKLTTDNTRVYFIISNCLLSFLECSTDLKSFVTNFANYFFDKQPLYPCQFIESFYFNNTNDSATFCDFFNQISEDARMYYHNNEIKLEFQENDSFKILVYKDKRKYYTTCDFKILAKLCYKYSVKINNNTYGNANVAFYKKCYDKIFSHYKFVETDENSFE